MCFYINSFNWIWNVYIIRQILEKLSIFDNLPILYLDEMNLLIS